MEARSGEHPVLISGDPDRERSQLTQRFLVSPMVSAIQAAALGHLDAATKEAWGVMTAPSVAARGGCAVSASNRRRPTSPKPAYVPAAKSHNEPMSAHGEPTRRDVEVLHRHVAELLDGAGVVVGWIALEKAPYRDLFLSKQLGCWLLVTWADGTIGIEEDHPPYLLVGDLMSGTWPDEDRAAQYAVRWVPDDRREELWERYGIHESAGHYMSIMDRQRRSRG